MTRRGADLEGVSAEADGVAVSQRKVDVRGPVFRREPDLAPERRLHQPRARDVVGVAVRVERAEELQAELADQRGVARVLLEDGIDEHRFVGAWIREEVRVGAGDLVEELSEDHGGLSGSEGVRSGRTAGGDAARRRFPKPTEPIRMAGYLRTLTPREAADRRLGSVRTWVGALRRRARKGDSAEGA